MVHTCVVTGCHERSAKGSNISFYRFPNDPLRKAKWVAAVRREAGWEPSKHSRLCSRHFITGRKNENPMSPDFVPSIFGFTKSPIKRKLEDKQEQFERRQAMKLRKRTEDRRGDAAGALLGLGEDTSGNQVEDCDDDMCNKTSVTQTDLSAKDIRMLEEHCQQLHTENIALKDACISDFQPEEDDKVKFYTGLPNVKVFNVVQETLSSALKGNLILTIFQQILLTFMRLRLNLCNQDLAYRFNVHPSTISRTFHNVLDIMYSKLVPMLIFWPSREQLQETMPISFRKSYPNSTVIIDCFEVFIERSSSLQARAQTYSSYKSHNTLKYLIGIAPQGMITFISKGWGGRTSDKYITENSGFLRNLMPGDVVLADRGFNIEDSVGVFGATLIVPPFTKGKPQLPKAAVDITRGLASVRIHIERLIGLTRQKYTILKGPVPISLLQKDDKTGLMTFDKMVHVACALVNMSESIVPKD